MLAKIYRNFVCVFENTVHHADLTSPFLKIFLVDTNCIDPEFSITLLMAQASESVVAIARD
jgi:hypothetical protein